MCLAICLGQINTAENNVHLANSPLNSSRPNSCRPSVVSKTPTNTRSKAKREADEINALIKQAKGGSNLNVVRERRKSKEIVGSLHSSTDTATMRSTSKEVDEINALIVASKASSAGAILRERRMSKDKVDATTNADESQRDVAETKRPEMVDAAKAPKGSAKEAVTVAKQRWRSAAAQVVAQHSPSYNGDEGESLETQLNRLLGGATQANLTGAAGRGARAAALSRVKAASAAVGGVFLSQEAWEAMRAEMTSLRSQNKRLLDERAGRKAFSPLKTQQKENAPFLGNILSKLMSPNRSPNLRRALEIGSPTKDGMRLDYEALEGCLSPSA